MIHFTKIISSSEFNAQNHKKNFIGVGVVLGVEEKTVLKNTHGVECKNIFLKRAFCHNPLSVWTQTYGHFIKLIYYFWVKLAPVLRIQLILMRIQNRNLDPHWEKMDPDPDSDPGYFFKIYGIFLTKQNFQIFCLIFSLIFMLKLNQPVRNQEIFVIYLF